MISERTLRKWRKEALQDVNTPEWNEANSIYIKERGERILKLTQELLDQHLIRN